MQPPVIEFRYEVLFEAEEAFYGIVAQLTANRKAIDSDTNSLCNLRELRREAALEGDEGPEYFKELSRLELETSRLLVRARLRRTQLLAGYSDLLQTLNHVKESLT